jgi:hypothetical protein
MPQPGDEVKPQTAVSLPAIFGALLAVALCGVEGGGGRVRTRRISVERLPTRDRSISARVPGTLIAKRIPIGSRDRYGSLPPGVGKHLWV